MKNPGGCSASLDAGLMAGKILDGKPTWPCFFVRLFSGARAQAEWAGLSNRGDRVSRAGDGQSRSYVSCSPSASNRIRVSIAVWWPIETPRESAKRVSKAVFLRSRYSCVAASASESLPRPIQPRLT